MEISPTEPEQHRHLVIISDTHNHHRKFNSIPDGDVLVHAGDYTSFGKIEHAQDFNTWLAALPHRHKIVINRNHENNSPWQKDVKEIISNATYLINESHCIERCAGGSVVKFYGTDFYWPMQHDSPNPNFDLIDNDTNVLLAHGPVAGYVDGGHGCKTLALHCSRLSNEHGLLRCVISGHIHSAHGVVKIIGETKGTVGIGDIGGSIGGIGGIGTKGTETTFINSSSCGQYRTLLAYDPIVLDI